MRQLLLLFIVVGLTACGAAANTPTAEKQVEPTVELQPTSIPSLTVSATKEPLVSQVERLYPAADFASITVDERYVVTEWQTGDPAAYGMDGDLLAQMIPYIEDELSQINSVLVVRDGVLVYEYYKDGRSAESADLVWSVTKSFTSILVGIAVDDGLLSLDQTLADILTPDQMAESDPDLAQVTVRDLLTMQSGIACSNDGCHDKALSDILEQPLRYASGEQFAYDTGASHLLSAVISAVSGQSLYEYAAAELFDPLDIAPPPWQIDAEDNPFGGKGLAMRPRDMAKFGQLILDDGVWDGVEVISADYINAATQNQLGTNGDSNYGYLFWINDKGEDAYFSAVGYGGQHITVVPAHELVIVITSSFTPYRSGSDTIIEPFIIDAVIE